MRHGPLIVLVALAVAAQGCVAPAAEQVSPPAIAGVERDDSEAEPAGSTTWPQRRGAFRDIGMSPAERRLTQTCGDVTLRVDDPTPRPADPVRITVRVENCGPLPLNLTGSELCPFTITRGGHEYGVKDDGAAGGPGAWPANCVQWNGTTIPTGGAYEQAFTWNGTFTVDPCVGGRCLQYAPGVPGDRYEVWARLTSADYRHPGQWSNATTVAISGDRPAEPSACTPVSLSVRPPAIVPGEDAVVVVRVENCTLRDVTIVGEDYCDHASGGGVRVSAGDESWGLRAAGAAVTDADARCYFPAEPHPRVILAGGFAEIRSGWNGTRLAWECDEGGDGGCTSTHAAVPPGEYLLESTIAGVGTAQATLRVLDS